MTVAIIFDFDGLILDTETPTLHAWQEEFERHGAELTLDEWIGIVGTHDPAFDPADRLAALVEGTVDRTAIDERQRRRKHELLAAMAPMPGVRAMIGQAADRGFALGIASSSRRRWVVDHLERLGLGGAFRAVVGRDDVGGRSKPAPDVYVEVCRRLGAEPAATVAVEDSQPGVAAAAAAGLRVVAVPNEITRHSDLSGADLVLDSLAGVDLEGMLRRVTAGS